MLLIECDVSLVIGSDCVLRSGMQTANPLFSRPLNVTLHSESVCLSHPQAFSISRRWLTRNGVGQFYP